MNEMPGRWYVVQTHPHSETKAKAHLERQGFLTYLPRHLRRRRHARRIETVAAPLFPRYLFVRIDMLVQRWRSIQSTVGIARLVCNGEGPAAVADAVVSGLRSREGPEGFILLKPSARFSPGEKVQIIDGVFASHLGLFEGMTDQERVAVLLELLGRKVRVVLGGELVTAA